MGVLRTGINVPPSAEYRDTTTNESLLASLAQLKPAGGKVGELIRLPEDPQSWDKFAGPNLFRRDLQPGKAQTGVWPLVVMIGACLFFFRYSQSSRADSLGSVGGLVCAHDSARSSSGDCSSARSTASDQTAST